MTTLRFYDRLERADLVDQYERSRLIRLGFMIGGGSIGVIASTIGTVLTYTSNVTKAVGIAQPDFVWEPLLIYGAAAVGAAIALIAVFIDPNPLDLEEMQTVAAQWNARLPPAPAERIPVAEEGSGEVGAEAVGMEEPAPLEEDGSDGQETTEEGEDEEEDEEIYEI